MPIPCPILGKGWFKVPKAEDWYSYKPGHPEKPEDWLVARNRPISPRHRKVGQLVKQTFDKSRGRYKWQLHIGNKKLKLYRYVLILLHFDGLPKPKQEALHGDDNCSDDRYSNLRWGTRAENGADSSRLGSIRQGKNHPLTFLTNSQVKAIRSDSRPQRVIAKEYGFKNPSSISRIKSREYWKHLK